MGIGGRTRRKGRRTFVRGADERASMISVTPESADAETRVITLSGGVAWLVTVVARLVSEDASGDTESARMVLRMECLSQPYRTVRVATVRASTLRTVDERRLRMLSSVPAIRSRYPAVARRWREMYGGGG